MEAIGHTERHEGKAHEDRGREGNDKSISQEMPRIAAATGS